jgi:predicted flavoprotein YhiN
MRSSALIDQSGTAHGNRTVEGSSKTMQAKRVRDLYVTGKAVSVTGQLGGDTFR